MQHVRFFVLETCYSVDTANQRRTILLLCYIWLFEGIFHALLLFLCHVYFECK